MLRHSLDSNRIVDADIFVSPFADTDQTSSFYQIFGALQVQKVIISSQGFMEVEDLLANPEYKLRTGIIVKSGKPLLTAPS